MSNSDEEYLQIVLDAVSVCTHYKPRFGQGSRGSGLSLEQFRELYQGDAFYSWFGLDHPLMYAAHKAAGGMTSVYRQIGIGCEEAVSQDPTGLSRSVRRRRDLVVPSSLTERTEAHSVS